VRKYQNSLSDIALVLNLDCVGMPGNLELLCQHIDQDNYRVLKDIAPKVSPEIIVQNHLIPFSDHFPFFLHGVQSVFCMSRGAHGRAWGHTTADTFEKVSGETLKKVSMNIARLVCHRAQVSDLKPNFQDKEEIAQLLREAHMEELLRYEGHWIYDAQD